MPPFADFSLYDVKDEPSKAPLEAHNVGPAPTLGFCLVNNGQRIGFGLAHWLSFLLSALIPLSLAPLLSFPLSFLSKDR